MAAGSEAAVTLILAHAPSVNATDSDGFSALYHAQTNQAAAVVARLRNAGAVESALELVARNQCADLKTLLTTNRPGEAALPWAHSPLSLAIHLTNVVATKLLLAAGANPNAPWPAPPRPSSRPGATNTARLLHAAVMLEQPALVRLLLEHSTDAKAFDAAG